MSAGQAGDAARRFAIDGEMTIYRAAELQGGLQAALTQGEGDFTIDLAAVNEMDSAGVQLLMAARKSAQAAGFALHVVGHSPAVVEVLDTLGLAALLGDAAAPADAAH